MWKNKYINLKIALKKWIIWSVPIKGGVDDCGNNSFTSSEKTHKARRTATPVA